MSVEALRWAYGLRGLSVSRAAVLHCLAWHHNGETGRCDPSAERVASETGLSTREVRRSWGALEALDLLTRLPRPGKASVLLLHVGAVPASATHAVVTEDDASGLTAGEPCPDVRTDAVAGGVLTGSPATTDSRSAKPERTGKQPESLWQAASTQVLARLQRDLDETLTASTEALAQRQLSELMRAKGQAAVTEAFVPANVRRALARRAWPFNHGLAGLWTAAEVAFEALRARSARTHEADEARWDRMSPLSERYGPEAAVGGG